MFDSALLAGIAGGLIGAVVMVWVVAFTIGILRVRYGSRGHRANEEDNV